MNNIDYGNDIKDDETEIKRFKSLCYEDTQLQILQNPTKRVRDLLGLRDDAIKERKALYAAIQSRYKYVTRASGTGIGKEDQLLRKLAFLEKRRLREIKKEFRRDYFYRIHDEEWERQMKKIVTPEYVKPVFEHLLPKRTKLQEILYDLSKDHSAAAIVAHRISTIN
ncbi:hypothetical protein BHYA_0056g00400 [Botrytis hyacinthi]|uniref:Uncharacterized protein n=1 Tax=Botrytis hyacinthi TaxID=278943 RepID=A0A4Z1GUA8_9HELO|nr:hypothetical protein BHYA_0056g00400 [Botrytis hyacinthi]